MLVLTRKVGETILIGPDITVMLVRIGPHSVKLGIKAPESTPILREDAKTKQPRERPGEARLRPVAPG